MQNDVVTYYKYSSLVQYRYKMNEINLPRCRLTFNSDWVLHRAEESMIHSCDDNTSSSSSSGFIQTDGSLMIAPSGKKVVFRKTTPNGTEPTPGSSCDRSFTLRLNFFAVSTSLLQLCVVSNAKFIELYRLNNQELTYVQTLRGAMLEAEDSSSSNSSSSSNVLFRHSCKDHFGIDEFHLKFLSIKDASVELSLTLSNFELLFEEKAITRNDYRASTSDVFNEHADNTAITSREGSHPSSETVATTAVQSAVQQQHVEEDTRSPSVEEADRDCAAVGQQPVIGSDRHPDQSSDPIDAIGRTGKKSDESHSYNRRSEAFASSSSAQQQQQHLDPNQLAAIMWTVKSTLINEIAELLDAKLQPIVSKLSTIEAQLAASEAKHRMPH